MQKLFLAALCFGLAADAVAAQEIPKLVRRDGHFALMVDGAPYLILGGQLHNSSAWASTLPSVWPDVEAMHLNTIAAPVYWEQLEPTEGTFDYTQLDELLKQSRDHNVRLVLLWFGTWKNGQMRYTPRWVKTDGKRFPRMVDRRGEPIEVLSANSRATLEADKKAFVALMRHLKAADGDRHTVIMVQVENESGAVGSVRDFSPIAEAVRSASTRHAHLSSEKTRRNLEANLRRCCRRDLPGLLRRPLYRRDRQGRQGRIPAAHVRQLLAQLPRS